MGSNVKRLQFLSVKLNLGYAAWKFDYYFSASDYANNLSVLTWLCLDYYILCCVALSLSLSLFVCVFVIHMIYEVKRPSGLGLHQHIIMRIVCMHL